MRKIGVIILLLVYSIIGNICYSQNIHKSTEDIVDMLGSRLSKLLEEYGNPVNLLGLEDGSVLIEYENYSFRVKEKYIDLVIFLKDYLEPVKGINNGDSKSSVIEKLGTPDNKWESKDKTTKYISYLLPGKDSYFTIGLDLNDLVKFRRYETK